MGEVYRSKDTRLDRIVAIKVLPSELSTPELRQRFEQEARAISNLSHPNICALYDIGHQDGVDFLVLEYLEGETLESRLRRGPLPLEQVFRYASEIADALNKAHRQGITHRDLKPGNIMLTKSGAKLLDFGLAKLRTQPTPVAAGLMEKTAENTKLTADGVLLGTFQYMAPEQLEGTETDARTDIFALGCVMYEIATGRAAFAGKTKASLIAAILASEPTPITSLQPLTPTALERVVKTCLAKDPDERFQSAHDVKLELKWIAEAGWQADVPASVIARHKRRERIAWIATAVVTLAALVFAFGYSQRTPSEERLLRSFILPPEKTTFVTAGLQSGPVAVSPDGQRLAFTAEDSSGKHLLWVRPLDSLSAQPLAGTEGASFPFWSPDSRYLGFFAGEKLKKVDGAGGPVLTLCDAPNGRGGSWSRDGIIIFTPATYAPLLRVSDAGGATTPATKLDESRSEASHRWPYFLPDGRHFLYLARSIPSVNSQQAIYAGALDSPEKKLILDAESNAAYSPPGYLIFWRDGNLMAQRFDAKRLELTGTAFPIAEDVQYIWNRSEAIFSLSQNGILTYQGGDVGGMTRLVWHDRSGKQLGLVGDPDFLFGPRLSPDGRRLAVTVFARRNRTPSIWLYELSRGVRTRFTFDVAAAGNPVWSPDGSRVVFASARKRQNDLYVKPSSGTSDEELLLGGEEDKIPRSWSSDGRFIAYEQLDTKGKHTIWILPLSGDRKPFPFRQTQFDELDPQFSPDGRWIAYYSTESGTFDVYIAPFPGPGGKFQVSTGGGITPSWRRDGKELFFLTLDGELMAVDVKSKGSTLETGAVRQLFQTHRVTVSGPQYDFPANAERFIVASAGEGDSSPITLVVNWTAALHK
jgi:serine/threonine protein kinase/Tol biopolymer transport system component